MVEISQEEGETFSPQIFTHHLVDFCRDRRLRTFAKNITENHNIMFKTMLKKTALSVRQGFPKQLARNKQHVKCEECHCDIKRTVRHT